MNIELSGTERALLHEVLAERLDSLREQIFHADLAPFKKGLKERRARLQELVEKLPS